MLLAGTVSVVKSLPPQDKGSLGKKKKHPVFVVTATPAVSKSMERLGKRKKLPDYVVAATEVAATEVVAT
jgi:hypothetical protein